MSAKLHNSLIVKVEGIYDFFWLNPWENLGVLGVVLEDGDFNTKNRQNSLRKSLLFHQYFKYGS